MRKSTTAIIAAAALVASMTAQPKLAEARCWGCWVGAGVAAGLIGGAVIAGWSHAYTNGSIYGPYWSYPAYSEYGYGYAPYGYFAPAYYVPPPGYSAQRPLYVHHYYYHYRHRYY